MRFVQFCYQNRDASNLGVELTPGGEIVDLIEVRARNLIDFINGGPEMVERAKRAAQAAIFRVPRSKITLLPPVTRPDKIICVANNFCSSSDAHGLEEPIIFSKFSSSLVGPYDTIQYPDCTEELECGVSLALVMGKRGKDIPDSLAMDYVFGFTVANDVSARDWQLKKNGGQWLIGPCVITRDEIKDVKNLRLRCAVSGQDAHELTVEHMVSDICKIVAYVSRFFMIMPGDIILTGSSTNTTATSEGQQDAFIKLGDDVECSIDGIGSIRNKFV